MLEKFIDSAILLTRTFMPLYYQTLNFIDSTILLTRTYMPYTIRPRTSLIQPFF